MTSIYIKGLEAVRADITNLVIKVGESGLNRARANAFQKYAEKEIAGGTLALRTISAATAFMRGDHEPINDTGELLKHIKVRGRKRKAPALKKNVIEAGYFTNSKKYPKRDEYSTTNLKINQIATLHHTGYRIPTTGEKGRKVLAYLGKHLKGFNSGESRVKASSGRQFIQVKPRPFLYKAAQRFAESGADTKAINQYVDDIFSKKYPAKGSISSADYEENM